jgi:hypothetical protein
LKRFISFFLIEGGQREEKTLAVDAYNPNIVKM